MASNNKLLGMTHDPEPAPFGHNLPPNVRAPMFMYHSTCPEGKVIRLDSEIERLEAEGWVDHRAKVQRLPGWEQFYDDYMAAKQSPPPAASSGEMGGSGSLPPSLDETPVSLPSPASEPTEDELTAARLKEESDKVEKARLEALERQAKGPEVFRCDICGKEYSKGNALRMHKMGAHKGK